MLIDHFTSLYAKQYRRKPFVIAHDGMAALRRYNWPGNIRELRNIVEYFMITHSGDTVKAEDIIGNLDLSPRDKQDAITVVARHSHVALKDYEYSVIDRVMRECGGNKTQAAKKLGISRPSLYHKLKQMVAARRGS